jgi:hypothetical protein
MSHKKNNKKKSIKITELSAYIKEIKPLTTEKYIIKKIKKLFF